MENIIECCVYSFHLQKNIGQQFKKEMQIKDLPPMMKRIREKMPPLDESESKDIGLCKLFVPDATQSMAQT